MAECKTCKGPTEEFKCDVCGEESPVHVADHRCGGEHCMPKCSGCGQAEIKCTCGSCALNESWSEKEHIALGPVLVRFALT